MLQPEARIGNFRLERIVDESGRSQVWIARDEQLSRTVALKVREFDNAADAELERVRFEQTARVAARVEHPGVIPVYEAGGTATSAYLAMRYIQGRSLDLWLRGNPKASPNSRYQLLLPIAEALDHAHALGVAHGSVLPSDVLVDESVSPARGTLAHFGRSATDGLPVTSSVKEVEGDRLAFRQLLVEVFGSTGGSDAPGTLCVDMLREQTGSSADDPHPTPPTVIRTRRAQSRSRRVGVIVAGAVAALVVVVGALEILQDGMATFTSDSGISSATSSQSQTGATPAADLYTSTAATAAPAGGVLILGRQFTSYAGSESKRHRKPAFRRRRGVDAADVVLTALAENPATTTFPTTVVALRGSAAKCAAGVNDALAKGPYSAIVVLESACTLTVAQILGSLEKALPPVYWLDYGSLSPSTLGSPNSIAPPARADLPGYEKGLENLREQVGEFTGDNFARVVPNGTYSDIARAAEKIDPTSANTPCFFVATRVDPALDPFLSEDVRIAHSIAELALGFGVDASAIRVAEVVPRRDPAFKIVLAENGTFTGSLAGDQQIVDAVRDSEAPCVLFEDRYAPWTLRLVNRLVEEFPDIKLFEDASVAELYSRPSAPPAEEVAAFTRIIQHPNVYSVTQSPYVSDDAPLEHLAWNVFDNLYLPVNYDRPYWWITDDYALILVAALIGTQPADRGDGRPGFGALDNTLWATAEADFLYDSAPVRVDPDERIYGGYLVRIVNSQLERDEWFYGGNTKLP